MSIKIFLIFIQPFAFVMLCLKHYVTKNEQLKGDAFCKEVLKKDHTPRIAIAMKQLLLRNGRKFEIPPISDDK